MPTSTFIADDYSTSWAARGGAFSGLTLDTLLEMGDSTNKGGPNNRRSTMHAWDLFNPTTGAPIQKDYVIDTVKVDWTSATTANSGLIRNLDHRMALMASDGHWDRSKKNSLSLQGGSPITYGPPHQGTTTALQLRNSASEVIAESTDAIVGGPGAVTSFLNFFRGFGCTIEVPAGEDVYRVGFYISRGVDPAPAQDVTIQYKAYTLKANGRQYAIDTLIGTSLAFSYAALPYTDTPFAYISVNFNPVIPAIATDRWLGFMVEGDWLEGNHYSTHQLRYSNGTASLDPSSYDSTSHGSTFYGTAEAGWRWENAFLWQYLADRFLPFFYDENSTIAFGTPYPRYFGAIMQHSILPGTWAQNQPVSYGSANSGATEIFINFKERVQEWIDSDWYVPNKQETYIGLIMEVKNPEDEVYMMHGPANTGGYGNIRLTLEYTIPPDDICSFGIQKLSMVESEKVQVESVVGSFSMFSTPAVAHEGQQIDAAVGSIGMRSSATVIGELELVSLEEQDEVVVDFGITLEGAVSSGLISTHRAIESLPISAQHAVESIGSEIDSVVGHHGVGVTSAVVSFPITVGEC